VSRAGKALALACALALGGCAHLEMVPPSVDVAAYHRIAVLPFASDSYFSTVGTELTDEVVVDLLKHAPGIEVMERARVDALLQEQSLARGGVLDPQTAVGLGKMLGVQGLVMGSISLAIGNIRPTPLTAQRIANGVATVRLIDAATGRVVWSERKRSDFAQFLTTEPDNTVSYVWTDQEMIQRVIQDLARTIAQAFYPHQEWR
jgi:TolB-like protein